MKAAGKPIAVYNRKAETHWTSPSYWVPMTTRSIILNVSGMTCGHCAATVERSVQAVPGVLAASVDLEESTLRASVDGRADERALRAAVERAGYEVA